MSLSDIFKKNFAKPEKTIIEDLKTKHKNIIDDFISKTSVPSIKLTAKRAECGLADSKFGGKPYMPKGFEYPCDNNGAPLRLLAQLNFDELPKLNGFPQKGILQFFVGEDDYTGVDFDNLTNQNGFRVIYHENVVSSGLLSDGFPELKNDGCFPFEGEFALITEQRPCPMTSNDFRFDKIFIEVYKKHIETNETSFFKLGEEIEEPVYNELSITGHRIGGYPYFTQTDPREYNTNLQAHTVMLLQIDSEGDGEEDIMWGDCGVANFFIKAEDLAALDFSNVLYTWDCC